MAPRADAPAPGAAGAAAWGEIGGAAVALHYGDAAAEYGAVREAAGVAERADLAVVRLWGRDPARMVHGLITNDLLGAPAGRAVFAAMLTPKGRMIAELRALRRAGAAGEEVLLLLPREALAGVREHLRRYVPPLFARWADASAEWSVLGIYGRRAGELLRAAAGPAAELPGEDELWAGDVAGAELVALGSRAAGGEPGAELLTPAGAAPAVLAALLDAGRAHAARPVGFAALETLRVEAGVPRYGPDLGEETIPTEAYEPIGMMPRTVSFTKGCYTGQEVIVRIAHRGHVNRYLRGLRLGSAALPALRTPLVDAESGKAVGWTASAVFSPRLRENVALAFVRREVAPGRVLRLETAEGAAAEVVPLPFPTPAD